MISVEIGLGLALKRVAIHASSSIYMNQQSMTSESHVASIDYRATIVIRSFICECDVALERYRSKEEFAYCMYVCVYVHVS